MKKYSLYIYSCMIVLAALFLPGCNSEETLIDNSVPLEKGKLSFVLPTGGNKAVTYASVTGEDVEYKIHNIRIYWFTEDDHLLYKRFASGDGTFAGGATESPDGDTFTAVAGNHQTVVTISTGEYTAASRFYIVANVNSSDTLKDANGDFIKTIKSDPLRDVRVGVTTDDEFEELLSNALDEGGTVRLLGTPIPMSLRADRSAGTGAKTPEGYIEVPDIAAVTAPIEAQLKRRVARFDVINTAGYSNFKITSIRVARAQNRVSLHDKPFTDDASAWSANNTYKFEVTQPVIPDGEAFNGPAGVLADFLPGGPLYDKREHLTKAAFYLYPTVIDSARTKTEIILEGLYDGKTPTLYTLDIPISKYPNNEIQIEANKVYRIYVHQALENKKTFQLFVDEWYDEDTIAAVNKDVNVTSWGTLTSSAKPNLSLDLDTASQATLNSFLYEFSSSDAKPDTLTLVTEGTNLTPNQQDTAKWHVTTIEITGEINSTMPFLQEDLDSLKKAKVISSTTLTYGTHYTTTHKIVLPPTIAPINALLKVKNSINPGNAKLINIRSNNYNRLGLKAVAIKWNDGTNDRYLFWAPVNVGADSLNTGAITNNTGSTVLPNTRRVVGNTYQWGRNVAFPGQGSLSNSEITVGDTAIFAADAVGLTTFVKRGAEGDWLKPSDSGLWSGVNAQGPCPSGWRIPTKDECQALIDASTITSPGALNQLRTLKAANGGGTLYFPVIGFRGFKGEAPNNTTTGPADYWTSTPSSTEGKTSTFMVYTTNGSDRFSDFGRAYGFFIRAVREIPALPVAPTIP